MLRAAPDFAELEEPSESSTESFVSDAVDESDADDDVLPTVSAHEAAAAGDLAVLSSLPLDELRGEGPGLAPVQIAAMHGHKGTVQWLVEQLGQPHVLLANPPVTHLAAMHGHPDVLTYLHSAGFDLSALDVEGSSAALEAAAYGQVEVLQQLLALGVQLQPDNSPSQQRLTVAHQAASHGFPEVLQLCIEHGTPVELRDEYGRTPLTIARARLLQLTADEHAESSSIPAENATNYQNAANYQNATNYQACVDLLELRDPQYEM